MHKLAMMNNLNWLLLRSKLYELNWLSLVKHEQVLGLPNMLMAMKKKTFNVHQMHIVKQMLRG